MRSALRWTMKGSLAGWLALGVCLSMAVLIWFGWRAMQEWQRSEELLAERRAHDTVDRFVTVLSRDMRGAQNSVLASWWDELMPDPAEDARNLVASAFAKFPYPESFFVWRRGTPDASMPFFNRSGRHPAWMPPHEGQDRFPVSVGYEPATAGAILGRIRSDVAQGRRFSIFEVPLGGIRYQVVAKLFYRDGFREQIEAIVGFTVSLPWVRQHYFPEVARQVARIGNGLPLALVDDRGQPVWGAIPGAASGPIVRRWFPVMFFDPLLVGFDSPADLARQSWAVEVGMSGDEVLGAATAAANRTLAIAAVAAAVLVLGLLLTARASLASARLSGLRSDFVSTVTHELKTPIATIRAIGDTLVRGRVVDPRAYQEYAQLVVQESKRLTRLVENLLAYARITDVTEAYAFGPIDLREVVEDAVRGFHTQLAAAGFEVHLDLAPDLPLARADRSAMGLVLDNVLDNAVRYSGESRWLQVRARREGDRMVVVEVSDRGVGIPKEEISQVTRRFFRGRGAPSSGSGLGLAIVSRIAADQGGALVITSTVGHGTTVGVTIPVAEGGHETDPDR